MKFRSEVNGPWMTLVLAGVWGLLGVPACSTFDESGLPGSASSMANNQLMFVSEEKQTFGFFRIHSLRQSFPDLDYFVRQRGMPEFLAETTNDGLHYYIFYYLDDRAAYASRPRPGSQEAFEFSGPYPITQREVRTLEQLRNRKPEQASEEWKGAGR